MLKYKWLEAHICTNEMVFVFVSWFKLGFLILVELYILAPVRNFQGVFIRQIIQCPLIIMIEF